MAGGIRRLTELREATEICAKSRATPLCSLCSGLFHSSEARARKVAESGGDLGSVGCDAMKNDRLEFLINVVATFQWEF